MIQQDPKVNFVDESLLELDPNVSIVRGYFSEVEDTEEAVHVQTDYLSENAALLWS